ncbi:MAG: hypothetical protein HZA08_10965 [Nitrospirae bacterium]|nr:hypothetical protein [Nitrospirota bacterium]
MMQQSIDTYPEAENIQISLIRKATIAKRVSRTRSFSQSIIQLSRKAIKRANPKLNERELILTFIAYHYGTELSDRLREYLDQKAL